MILAITRIENDTVTDHGIQDFRAMDWVCIGLYPVIQEVRLLKQLGDLQWVLSPSPWPGCLDGAV